MIRVFIWMWIFVLTGCYLAECQNFQSVDNWMEFAQDWTEEIEDEGKAEALFAELAERAEHPYDLNRVERTELEKLPFLSDRQIDHVLAYRKRYGPFVSLYELKQIDGLDAETISLLISFVYIGDYSVDKYPLRLKNLFKYGTNELSIRYDRCFQQKKGYFSYPDSLLEKYPNRKYLGEPFYHSIRYSYGFREKIQAGFVAEKDAGEPFWKAYHKGYDFYSGHLLGKGKRVLKTWVIGDYKASFGQGLTMSHDFSPGRNMFVTQLEKRNSGFRRHLSTNETDFFRGAALTLTWKKIDISGFYSYRKMDAALDAEGRFSGLKTDGLHRVQRDWEKRRRISMQTYGGHVEYMDPRIRIGMTAVSYSFGHRRFEPEQKPYNTFYFRGSKNTNFSVNYRLKNKQVEFYGETACSINGAFATLNAFRLTPASYFSLLALYRYYDRRYQSYHGNAFGQNGTVQNEEGVYLGMEWTPFAYWKVTGYVDFFRFPWLKYGVDAPSSGWEYMAQILYTFRSGATVYIRYKSRQKEKNAEPEEVLGRIRPYRHQRLRMQAQYGNRPVFDWRTSIDGILYTTGEGKRYAGWMVAQSFGWRPNLLPVRTDWYVAWFDTEGYDTRINSYEKNLSFVFNRPSLYGKGMRLSASFGWQLGKELTLSVKMAHTYYADRNRIGTDGEEIEGHHRSDLSALLRWKF